MSQTVFTYICLELKQHNLVIPYNVYMSLDKTDIIYICLELKQHNLVSMYNVYVSQWLERNQTDIIYINLSRVKTTQLSEFV